MTQENEKATDVSVVERIENMFKGLFASMQYQGSPLPYAGDNPKLYADMDNYKYPIANAFGDISRYHLGQAIDEVSKLNLSPEKRIALGTHLFSQYTHAELNDEELLKRILDILNNPTEDNTSITVDVNGADRMHSYLSQDETLYEFPLAVQFSSTEESEDGLTWRTILRTGRWSIGPQVNNPWSDNGALVVTPDRLQELKASFDEGAFEYVTVPDTHNETPLNNRGFIKNMQIVEDDERIGEYKLKAGFEITSEEAKKSILEGSIAGVSCGIIFDHVRKVDGKKFTAAIHHVALTNQPWIDGLGGWEKIAASQYNISNVVVGTEENKNMGSTDNISAEEYEKMKADLQAALDEAANLRLSATKSEVKELLDKYQKEKHLTPAMLNAIEPVLLSAKVNSTKVMALSDDGKSQEVDLEAAITAMLDAMPKGLDLTSVEDAKGTEITPDQSKPTDTETNVQLSAAERAEKIRQELGLSLAATGDA